MSLTISNEFHMTYPSLLGTHTMLDDSGHRYIHISARRLARKSLGTHCYRYVISLAYH